MPSKKLPPTEPQIIELPAQKMAVVTGKGAPQEVFPKLMPALFGSVFTLKMSLKKAGKETFTVSGLRGRYPDAGQADKKDWTMHLALPVPNDTTVLPQKVPDVEVKLETWKYGPVAQVLYLGQYSEETLTIEKLIKYIHDSGYEISGYHEEEYLSKPDAKVPKTIIRYEVRKIQNI
jgi:hypothetical protein